MQFIFEKICVIAENDIEVKANEYFTEELKKRGVAISDSAAKSGKSLEPLNTLTGN